jgi:hypothetical protein
MNDRSKAVAMAIAAGLTACAFGLDAWLAAILTVAAVLAVRADW